MRFKALLLKDEKGPYLEFNSKHIFNHLSEKDKETLKKGIPIFLLRFGAYLLQAIKIDLRSSSKNESAIDLIRKNLDNIEKKLDELDVLICKNEVFY